MKGLQGNFMSEPRVFAHSATNILPSKDPIRLIDDRGVALYVGSGGNMVVKMEGSHYSTDPFGVSHLTNINVFSNVPNGLFMPILVTHVLDNDNELWEQWENYYRDKMILIQSQITQLNKEQDKLKAGKQTLEDTLANLQAQFDDKCKS